MFLDRCVHRPIHQAHPRAIRLSDVALYVCFQSDWPGRLVEVEDVGAFHAQKLSQVSCVRAGRRHRDDSDPRRLLKQSGVDRLDCRPALRPDQLDFVQNNQPRLFQNSVFLEAPSYRVKLFRGRNQNTRLQDTLGRRKRFAGQFSDLHPKSSEAPGPVVGLFSHKRL